MTVQIDRGIRWEFWFKWVFANAVAFTVAYALANDIANVVTQFLFSIHVMTVTFEIPSTSVFGGMVFGAINGVLIGAVQSLILHQHFRQAAQWTVATGLGESLAAGLNNFGAITAMTAFPLFVPGAVVGIFIGATQWIVLRPRFSNSAWWIVANAIGLGIVAATSFGLESRSTESIAYCLKGIIFGAITGSVLIYLINHPKQSVSLVATVTQIN